MILSTAGWREAEPHHRADGTELQADDAAEGILGDRAAANGAAGSAKRPVLCKEN